MISRLTPIPLTAANPSTWGANLEWLKLGSPHPQSAVNTQQVEMPSMFALA